MHAEWKDWRGLEGESGLLLELNCPDHMKIKGARGHPRGGVRSAWALEAWRSVDMSRREMGTLEPLGYRQHGGHGAESEAAGRRAE